MRVPAVLALGLGMAVVPSAASGEWVDWIADARTGFEYNDNLNVSAFRDDEESDYAWLFKGRGGRVYQLTDDTRLSLAAELASRKQFEFEDFDRVELVANASILHKFGVGPNEPRLRIHGSAGRLWVSDDVRDSWLYAAGVDLLKRFSPRFDASLSFAYTNRDGGNGGFVLAGTPTNVWDQENFEFGVRGNYIVWEDLLLSAGYRFRDGEFDSSCTVGNVAKVIEREGDNLKAIAVNDVFGGCTYRLGGQAHSLSVNLNYAIGRRWSVDAGYEFRQGKADVLIYRNNIATLSVLFRY